MKGEPSEHVSTQLSRTASLFLRYDVNPHQVERYCHQHGKLQFHTIIMMHSNQHQYVHCLALLFLHSFQLPYPIFDIILLIRLYTKHFNQQTRVNELKSSQLSTLSLLMTRSLFLED
jgi:hypothetical protein